MILTRSSYCRYMLGCFSSQKNHQVQRSITSTTALRQDSMNIFNWLASKTQMATANQPTSFTARPFQLDAQSWPYKADDFKRMDESSDDSFYNSPRFVTHIDNGAIAALKSYYSQNLPSKGRILDLCSSWISHLPQEHEDAVTKGELTINGVGMNARELNKNPVLPGAESRVVQDLNVNPVLGEDVTQGKQFDSVTCVVSIDYLTRPLEVLESARQATREGGSCHLAVSNRCFPTKAIGRWLRVSEEERLRMVGHYMYFSGWRNIEIVDVVEKGGWGDPLWVVRGKKT